VTGEDVRPTVAPDDPDDAAVPAVWRSLGLPGLIDVHVHFMPERLLARVWAYFDTGGPLLRRPFPVAYRFSEEERIARLRALGVRAWTALLYPHRPGMAESLNEWGRDFARRVPEALQTATFFPEPSAARYTADALAGGARAVKAHVAVGRYDPRAPELREVWGLLEDSGTPVVVHASSSPAGPFTGAGPLGEVLNRFPRLRLVFAHLGMPEYADFFRLAEDFPGCGLDVSMVFDDDQAAAAPDRAWVRVRLRELADRIYWGTDYPNTAHAVGHQLRRLVALDLGDDWLRGVLHDNAARLFGLTAE
jgi:hypothetical protein